MESVVKRRIALLAAYALVALLAFGGLASLAGCAKEEPVDGAAGTVEAGTELLPVRVGTLTTDDLLPLWVAEGGGQLTEAGLDVEITVFASAQEQIAAISAGEIDAIMTDMVVPVNLTNGGTPVRAVTAMQTAPAGIVAGKGSGITSVSQLAGVKTGNSSGTILEYIYASALADAGVPADQIVTEEIKALPVRVELLNSGQIKAAMLPWTLYGAGLAAGGVPVLDRAAAEPYSQTVLAFSQKFLDQDGADDTVAAILAQWDVAVDTINADPNAQRDLLAEKTGLGEKLAKYELRTYPKVAAPDQEMWEDVVTWMVDRGYLKAPIAYDQLVYQP